MTTLARAPTMGHHTNGPCNESPTPTGREREEKEEVNIDTIACNIDRNNKN
jgi:hypothetical protein